jgi:hypothetical protein
MFLPAVLLILAFTTAQKPTCNSRYVRKEFRELIGPNNTLNAEGQTFVDAIKCVINQTGTTGGSLWDDFTTSHATANQEAHKNARFFPWHRLYLIHLEKAMSDCMQVQIAFPYWDGTLDSQAPEASVIWDHLGGNGDATSNGCVTDGPAAGVTFRYPTPGCLKREFGLRDFSSPEVLALFVASSQGNYEEYRSRMETTYHASVHVFVGGTMLNSFASPNDVVFFLHHAFVDKLYADWQNTNAENLYIGNE